MTNKVIVCIVLVFNMLAWNAVLKGQCPQSITLTNQAEIDDFLTSYPNCTHIPGDLLIGGDDINNLNALTNVSVVGGDFLITNCPLLPHLEGIEQLDSVYGDFGLRTIPNIVNLDELNSLVYVGNTLDICNDSELTNVSGLSNLTFVGNHISFNGLPEITSLEGMENITHVPGFLWVRNCHSLTNLEGLQNIETVGNDVALYWNYEMETLEGLRSLKSVGEDFNINFQTKIISLHGLDSLQTVGGFFSVGSNDALTSLDGIEQLRTIGGNLGITGNDNLLNLDGLIRLESVGASLWINGNVSLSDCAAFGICEILPPINDATINNNLPGCNTKSEIEASCDDKFGEVTGLLFMDFDCDGTFNNFDVPLPYTLIENTVEGTPFAFCDLAGNYQKKLLDNSTFEFSGKEINSYTPFPESYVLNTGPNAILFDEYNFGYCPDSLFSNISCELIANDPPRPGFSNSYHICVRNEGTQPEDVTLDFQLEEDLEENLFAITNANNGVITNLDVQWEIEDLPPAQQQCFIVTLELDPTVPLGFEFSSSATASIVPTTTETTLEDNMDSDLQTVVGSYDPNDKAVDRTYIASPSVDGEWLEYHIRFQNTGTFPATFVEVRDTLREQLDIRTFEMIGASHSYELTFPEANQLAWRFDNINLPDSTTNEQESHGFITFKIKTMEDLSWDDPVQNRAGIYFDFNPVVLTNFAETSNVFISSNDELESERQLVQIMPNPAKDEFWITNNGASIQEAKFFSSTGKYLKTYQLTSEITKCEIGTLPDGLYFLMFRDGNGQYFTKPIIVGN